MKKIEGLVERKERGKDNNILRNYNVYLNYVCTAVLIGKYYVYLSILAFYLEAENNKLRDNI